MKKPIILLLLIFSVCISGYSQYSNLTKKNQIFIDDFESYNVNEQLVCQNSEDWTTLNNLPCTYQDPYITDSIACCGNNSIVIVDSNDLVKPIDNFTFGRYKISFKMFIPDGSFGYFMTLQKFEGFNSNWGMQVFFQEEGNALIVCPSATPFQYNYNAWNSNDIIIDLDHDFAQYFHNNILIEEWCWSYGGGWSGINQLAGTDFCPWTNVPQGVAKYYIDDYQIEELEPLQLLPPENLTLETSGSDIILYWDSPLEEYWLHYDGENSGNGIGPGPVYTAARFLPEDIQDLDGWYLTRIKFFAKNSDCSYSLRVWTGENAGNLIFEYDVPEYIPDSWNEIELNIPILIDASQELWLGNICSSINAWDYPAACDDGPAIPYKGDLVSFDGVNWVSISLEYGLDYNWNIRGLVVEDSDTKGSAKHLIQHKALPLFRSDNTESKNLIGYNIYHSFNWEPYALFDFTTENTWSHEDLLVGHYSYYVTALYDEGESISTDTVSAFLSNINENKITKVLIYPNPAKDFAQIISNTKITNLKMYDLTGEIIEKVPEINQNNFNLSVSEYNTGVYIIRIESESNTINKRIIIQ